MPEDGPASKKTVFIANVAEGVDESALLEGFSTFGDVVDVQLPLAATNPAHTEDKRHRGFAFVTYAAAADAQDAIDNMDLNVFHGKVIKVNIATSTKMAAQPAGNRPVWETEEWLKTYGNTQGKGGKAVTNAPAAEPAKEADEDAMEE
ncbi:RNA-binding domain-containing protein [Auricularia subglabra TFB-10046 SS5]|nr:RNA-binding domain-containing protein [Auricularia subglabra TFB-10046 SS5]